LKASFISFPASGYEAVTRFNEDVMGLTVDDERAA
jgi:hypothetical protein